MSRPVRFALLGCGGLFALGFLAVMGVIVLITLQNRPPDVPADFRAPNTLPIAALTAPPGALFYDSDRTGNFEIYRAETAGGTPRALTADPAWDSWWPRLSPDRRHVLYYRTPAGVHDQDFTKTHLWVMDADGTNATELRPPGLDGWAHQGHAEWSPDGTEMVMFGGSKTNAQIYVTDAVGQHPRQVTDRGGTNIDPSFSPDGRTIAFVGCPANFCRPENYEVYFVDAAGGDPRQITHDDLRDQDPYFSPDGRQVAWLTQTSAQGRHPGGSWNIRIANADGSDQRRLTDDDQINSKPEWSRDSSTVFFHRLELPRLTGFSIFAVNADGSGLHEVTAGQPGVNEFPST